MLERSLLQDIGLSVSALLLILYALVFSETLGLFSFLFMSMGICFAMLVCYDIIKVHLNFITISSDVCGLAWVWVVGFGLSLPFCAFLYWMLDYPFDIIARHCLGLYTFSGTMAYAWTACQIIVSYLLAFVVIYSVIWVIVNSKSSEGIYYG